MGRILSFHESYYYINDYGFPTPLFLTKYIVILASYLDLPKAKNHSRPMDQMIGQTSIEKLRTMNAALDI